MSYALTVCTDKIEPPSQARPGRFRSGVKQGTGLRDRKGLRLRASGCIAQRIDLGPHANLQGKDVRRAYDTYRTNAYTELALVYRKNLRILDPFDITAVQLK